ncbi:MAG TPA: ferredoxin, partial [Jatrophihabitans sp.]|nr:ferredoxin [Jatrophihabitans sp.]
AIFYEDDLPSNWSDYTQANVDFFDDLGSPGGASKVGKTAADPKWIMDLPPQGEGH